MTSGQLRIILDELSLASGFVQKLFEKGEIDFTEVTQDISFNMEKRPELKDKAVCQTFAYAIHEAELVEKVLRGADIAGSAGYLPQEHPY
ncbi:hypothetical protein LOZ80_19665 [Paenibacillus sp. HWE-109]|uniref:hypothetical protein n=1 Tax=Paenibacillus sp. HWE-109 TaxID=1306526 RepID=UPI001EDD8A92|nr:hypothetical protein [Paenibacillus sp. HWE-109]UKS23864.1 hypothetical protein LOZ80_19665 [Paenibacillus sp. HWE-109]